MSAILQSVIANTLRRTLDRIIDDKTDGIEEKAVFKKYCEVDDTDLAFVDHLEMGGPGLASEVPEGSEIPLGTVHEGAMTRYFMRKIGQRLLISDEAIEDCKYPEAIKAARRLKRSLWKTLDYVAANLLARAWNTSYPGGDGLPLCSASHTLPGGGTFSNTLSVPQSPSRGALILLRALVRKVPDHDGLIGMRKLEAIICPTEQVSAWEEVIKSEKAPESGEFNRYNVANHMGLEIIEVPFWTNTTTNWIAKTDDDNGLLWYWRRKPKASTTVNNEHEVMSHQLTCRFDAKWSDPRAVYGSQA